MEIWVDNHKKTLNFFQTNHLSLFLPQLLILNMRFLLLLFCISSSLVWSQKKVLNAIPTQEIMVINAEITESIWENTEIATGFVMTEPDNGVPAAFEKRTEVKVVYDNEAIYIAAKLYDHQPQLIQKELTQRDNFGVSDHFGVFINGFNDGQQDFRFFVSAAGVQMDCLATELTQDFSWDAIWESAVKITEFGWVVELKIPYAALRFGKKEHQVWGLNFQRELRRDRQIYNWNPVDASIGAIIPQAGILQGIKNINPPTRLFFIPYGSSYVEKNQNGQGETYKAGLDIKYGINDSFTLDAILIPDFGQAAFDDVELNLSPFEQQFNENRPFFTEGTDLFSKGNLLYSRRIGGNPSRRLQPNDDETIIGAPTTVNLINATKISGRNKKGLGVGFLNAVTEQTFGTIQNNNTGEISRIEIEPLTNYNVTVFDQRFNQNSSVAFVNTNVWRNGDFRDANVSAVVFDLNTPKNTYNLSGDFKYSSIRDFENTQGFNTTLEFAKTHSQHRYSVRGRYFSKDYNINDLGINFMTNFHSVSARYNYRILNPVGIFNTFRINTNFYSEIHNGTGKIQQTWYNIVAQGTTRKNDFMQIGIYTNPFETYDFYEPRLENRWLNMPKSHGFWMFFSSNYNRKFALDFEPSYRKYEQNNRADLNVLVSPRFRFSDKFSLIYSINYIGQTSDVGWVDFQNNESILAERDRTTLTNAIRGKFSLNETMTFNLVTRHYISYAENLGFFDLQNDGSFTENTTYNLDRDSNLNLWNFDLSYSWWFAPGSEISVLYRNNAQNFSREISRNMNENVSNLFQNNLNHTFSISIRYFVDYNRIKNWI